MGIEFLNENNIDELVSLFSKGYASSSWQHHQFDSDFLKENLKNMLGKQEFFVCMYRKEQEIVGGFLASIGQFLFSKTLAGIENGIYIEPKHRGGRIALLMYNEFVKWCDKMGAEPFVEIFFNHDEDNEKTYQFFRKVGMVECGRMFRSKRHVMLDKN